MTTMEERMQLAPVLDDVLRMDNDELRGTEFGRIFGHHAGFDACADSVRSVDGRIYLPRILEFPGEPIEELIGEVTEVRRPAGGPSGPTPPGLIHLWDRRKDSPYESRFEHPDEGPPEWVSYFCDPPVEVRRLMEQGFGSWGLEVIPRTGNEEAPPSVLLVANWSSIIGGRWLTVEIGE